MLGIIGVETVSHLPLESAMKVASKVMANNHLIHLYDIPAAESPTAIELINDFLYVTNLGWGVRGIVAHACENPGPNVVPVGKLIQVLSRKYLKKGGDLLIFTPATVIPIGNLDVLNPGDWPQSFQREARFTIGQKDGQFRIHEDKDKPTDQTDIDLYAYLYEKFANNLGKG